MKQTTLLYRLSYALTLCAGSFSGFYGFDIAISRINHDSICPLTCGAMRASDMSHVTSDDFGALEKIVNSSVKNSEHWARKLGGAVKPANPVMAWGLSRKASEILISLGAPLLLLFVGV